MVIRLLTAASLAMFVTACVSNKDGSSNFAKGAATVACGVGGGYLGSLVGGGSGRIAATGAGAALGALACNQLVSLLEESDLAPWRDAIFDAAERGETTTWTNSETGNSGKITPTGSSTQSNTQDIKVLKDRVDTMPPLTAIGSYYEVTSGVNVRGGPGTDYRTVRSPIPAGSVVFVTGQVKGSEWFAIDDEASAGEKVTAGFVHSDFLRPSPDYDIVIHNDQQERETETKTQVVEQECKEMSQDMVLGDGTVETNSFTICRTANGGWEAG